MKLAWILGILFFSVACSNSYQNISDTEPVDPELKMDASFDCQPDRMFHGIVNGTRVKPQDQVAKKAVLLVIKKKSGRVICTGTAISSRTILTAAHCTSGASKTSIAAVFHPDMKCSSGYSPKQAIKAVDFVNHPSYSHKANAVGDVALIKLERNVPHSYISKLYDGNSKITSDEALLIGYGASIADGDDIKVLRKAYKKLSTEAERKGERLVLNQSQGTGGVCTGDSGGPVYVKSDGSYQVLAVNSVVGGADNEADACNYFSVGMYVPAFLPWIRDQVQIFEGQN